MTGDLGQENKIKTKRGTLSSYPQPQFQSSSHWDSAIDSVISILPRAHWLVFESPNCVTLGTLINLCALTMSSVDGPRIDPYANMCLEELLICMGQGME